MIPPCDNGWIETAVLGGEKVCVFDKQSDGSTLFEMYVSFLKFISYLTRKGKEAYKGL